MVWKSGESGNLNGRPKGTRDKFNQDFLRDLSDSWEKNGKEVLSKLVKDDPATYARLAASIVPKDIKVEHNVNLVTDILTLVTQRQHEALEARNNSERVIEHESETLPVDTLNSVKEKVINK